MTDRPILEIGLDDSAFTAFMEKFREYQDLSEKGPGAWAKIDEQTEATRTNFDRMTTAMEKIRDTLVKVEQRQAAVADAAGEQATTWGRARGFVHLAAADIGGATLSLMRWGGLTSVFGALIAGGGLYGINRMATGVDRSRSSAMGLGAGYGEYQSARTNLERLGNAEGLMNGFNQALHGANERTPLYQLMGGDTDRKLAGKSTVGAIAEALPYIKKLVDQTDPNVLGTVIQARGLDRLGVDLPMAKTIKGMSTAEMDKVASDLKSDAARMDPGNAAARKWQDFTTAIDRAGSVIRTTFERNLAPLAPSMEHVANAAASLAEALLKKGGPAEDWLKRANKGLQAFSAELSSASFDQKIDAFLHTVSQVNELAGRIKSTGNPDSGLFGGVPADASQRKANRYFNRIFGFTHEGDNRGAEPGNPSLTQKAGSWWSSRPGAAGDYTKRLAEARYGGRTEAQGPRSDEEVAKIMGSQGPVSASSAAVDLAETRLGQDDSSHRADIAEYLRTGGHGMDPARVAWCAAFVGATLRKAGLQDIPAARGGNMALSYRNWGVPATGNIRKGDLIIKNRGGGHGHIGFATGEVDARGRLGMISGNHSHRVASTWENPDYVIVRRAETRHAARNRLIHRHLGGGVDHVEVHDNSDGGVSVSTHREYRGPQPMPTAAR